MSLTSGPPTQAVPLAIRRLQAPVLLCPPRNVTVTARYLLKDDANHNGKPDDEEDKFDIRYTTVEAAGVSGMPADVTDVLPGTADRLLCLSCA